MESTNEPLIDLRAVVKVYETGAGRTTVLKNVSLQVQPGEFVSVVGPSGSGKSTLLNMITGIDRPTSGEVYVGGEAVHKLSENQLARWRGREIGVVRAIGATSPAIARLFVIEGVLIGMLSWLLAWPLSYPGALAFSNAVGQTVMHLPLDFAFSVNGVIIWLSVVLVLSALASLWPALRATRVSVREALAYE